MSVSRKDAKEAKTAIGSPGARDDYRVMTPPATTASSAS
jgi:hypothetical protein